MSSKRQQKAGWLLPPPGLESVPLVPFCGFIPDTPETRSALRYQVRSLGYWFNWQRDTDKNARIVADYLRQVLQSFKIGECCFMFRQKPTDHCVLQQSCDGGETWTDIFDFSLCLPSGLGDVITSNAVTEITNIENIYNQGGEDAVAPDMVYDNTSRDLFRDDLLCVMTQVLVQSLVDTEIDRRTRQANDWRAVGNFLETVGFALAGFTGGWSILGTQIAQGILENAADAWVELSEAILQDEQAQLEVACCWYKNLRGQTVTASRFSNSLNSCNFAPLSFEEQIRGAIAPLLDTTTNEGLGFYLAFLNQLQDMMALADLGLFDNCGCDNVCQLYDFAEGQHGFVLIPGVPSGFQWVNGLGLEGVPQHQIGQDWNAVEVRKQFATQTVERIEMIFDLTEGEWDTTNQVLSQVSIVALLNGNQVAAIGVNYDVQPDGTNLLLTLEVGNQDIDEIRLRVRAMQFAVATDDGYCLIRRCEVICPSI